jgi:hypothetical protein
VVPVSNRQDYVRGDGFQDRQNIGRPETDTRGTENDPAVERPAEAAHAEHGFRWIYIMAERDVS